MSKDIYSPLVSLFKESFQSINGDGYFFKGKDATLKYSEFWSLICNTRGLLRRLGVVSGQRALIVSKEKHIVAVLYVASLLEGVTAIVLDPDASGTELELLTKKSDPAIIFIDSQIFSRVYSLQRAESEKVVEIDCAVKKAKYPALFVSKEKKNSLKKRYPAMLDFESAASDFLELSSDTAGLVLFTSGTTGKPKGVVHTHASLYAQMEAFIQHFGLSKGAVIANHLPLHHTDGLNQGVLLPLVVKSQWLVPPSPDMQNIGQVLDLIYRERATHFITVPTVLGMIERLPEEFDDSFSSPEFQFVESTAGPLDKEVWERFEQRFTARIVNCYGLTETVCESIYCGPDETSRRVGSVGKPVQCDVKIVSPKGCEVEPGKSGELCIRTAAMMQGYLDDPGATSTVLKDGWFYTGDLARLDDDGFVYIVGRIKNIIIRGGINIIPEEVSGILKAFPGIDEAVVIGLPDQLLGEKVIACVVSHSCNPLPINDIFIHCRDLMAKEKLPNKIIQVEGLPYGPSGKVDLPTLKVKVGGDIGGKSDIFSGKESDICDKVLMLGASVFRVSIEALSLKTSPDNLREWDSLAFLELLMVVESEFQIKLDASDVLKIRSLGDLVCLLGKEVEAVGV
ncbi:AMP-binding protein [Microbulbifer sp. VAAF005]|uniref:AMP-binding protein n=1 Tax=Microbulbifer sp. VAAF005 TaxID=3034230 RepID=UPI0024AD4855|nr:AMP-binding protein [Microbulbifer sp. VAAF005]WHI48265.1 AMP-binding protein [Microbulbifer sp. VAAF005]